MELRSLSAGRDAARFAMGSLRREITSTLLIVARGLRRHGYGACSADTGDRLTLEHL